MSNRLKRVGAHPWSAVRTMVLAAAGVFGVGGPVLAQDTGFEQPWRLDPAATSLTFQSVKKGTIVETSKFATLDGTIAKDGSAEIKVVLESVDTGIDLRNVRMRFLFFETYKFPVATITAKIDQGALNDLPAKHRLRMDVDYTMSLHGVEKQYKSPVVVTLIDNDTVSIASAAPVIIPVADFDLGPNITKLEQAVGNITITPTTSVSFDFVFDKAAGDGGEAVVAVAEPEKAALESSGDLTKDECTTRFDVLSRTQSIYFRSGSRQLKSESGPLLETVVDIAKRCPDLKIEVAGYTDSDGSEAANQKLSEQRASTVAFYLKERGVPAGQLTDVGFGESNPVAPNDTADNKSRNRRIEFHASGG